MRPTLARITAAVAGVATAVAIASCGSSAGLIPPSGAGTLQSDLDAVAQAVQSGDCAGAAQAVSKVQSDIAGLPATVDTRLRDNLGQGASQLLGQAQLQCGAHTTSTTTTPTTPTTTTTTTPTTTTPTVTTTTPTTPTTTQQTTPTTPPDNGGGTPAPGNGNGNGNGGGGGGNQP